MNSKRFFFSFNEDCEFNRKIVSCGFILIFILFILSYLDILPLKKIMQEKHLNVVFMIMVLFGLQFFYIIFLDVMPNIFKNIPRIILIITALILIPISYLVVININIILGFSILILINYIVGFDEIFDKRNLMENISVSLIRFINFLISVYSIIFIFIIR